MPNIHLFSFNLFEVHTMVVWKEGPSCVIIDPGFYTENERNEFYNFLNDKGLTPEAILLTHGHMDHTWGVKDVQDRYGVPVYMNSLDAELARTNASYADIYGLKAPDFSFSYTGVEDGMTIRAAGMEFTVITTPGHTRGGVCYLEKDGKVMFTGDTLFAGTIGRTDFQESDYDDEIRSIMEKLIWLDPDIEIFPGHGRSSTIGVERAANPFLEPFNEKEEMEDL